MLNNPDPNSGAGVSLLRLSTVKERTGLGRTVIYDLIGRGEFPAPIHVAGTRISAWPSHLVDRFIAAQIAGGANG